MKGSATLLRRLPLPRGYHPLLLAAALGTGGAIILAAESLAAAVAGLDVSVLPWLAGAVAARAAFAGFSRLSAGRASAQVRLQLRDGLLASTGSPGMDPGGFVRRSGGREMSSLSYESSERPTEVTGSQEETARGARPLRVVAGWRAGPRSGAGDYARETSSPEPSRRSASGPENSDARASERVESSTPLAEGPASSAAQQARSASAPENSNGGRVAFVSRGLDALDPYVADYLPKRAGAAVIPITLLGWMAVTDLASALIVLATLPLIPLLAALVGWHTAAATRRQWRLMDRLGGHFLDAVAGLATLRAFGRDGHQVGEVRRTAEAHRGASMSVLRVAFLSALVLELVAALSVALVAVPLGLRLLEGTVGLQAALVVLLLAPEIYLPVRAVGSAFHTAADGMQAAERALEEGAADGTQSPKPITAAARVPDAATSAIRMDGVAVHFPGRDVPALNGLSCEFRPGERVALAGPSGAGKSTVLRLVLGLVSPCRGRVLVDGADLADLDAEAWRRQLAWVPQEPHVFTDTLAANIALGCDAGTADPRRLRAAAEEAQAWEFCGQLGWEAPLGPSRLSAGQRQRLALARAAYRRPCLMLLDEPTARLDLKTEDALLSASRDLLAERRAIVVAHRPALLDLADRVLWLAEGRLQTVDSEDAHVHA